MISNLKKIKSKLYSILIIQLGNFLENDFAPPPPINFVRGSYMLDMDIIDHMAAALGPLACPSRSARPRKCLNLT